MDPDDQEPGETACSVDAAETQTAQSKQLDIQPLNDTEEETVAKQFADSSDSVRRTAVQRTDQSVQTYEHLSTIEFEDLRNSSEGVEEAANFQRVWFAETTAKTTRDEATSDTRSSSDSELQRLLAEEVEHRGEFCQNLIQHMSGAHKGEGASVPELMSKLQEQDSIVAMLLQRCLELSLVSRRQRGVQRRGTQPDSGYQSTVLPNDIRRRAMRFSNTEGRDFQALWRQLSSQLSSMHVDAGREEEREAVQHSDQSD